MDNSSEYKDRITYRDTKSKDYVRAFANTSVLSYGPYGEIVIDFYEETLEPMLVIAQSIGSNEVLEYNHEPSTIVVEREKKFSVTLAQEQALQIAHWIFENRREDEGF